jgi:hypothetical protein
LTKETSTTVSGIVPEPTIMLQDRRGRTRRVLFSMIREWKLSADSRPRDTSHMNPEKSISCSCRIPEFVYAFLVPLHHPTFTNLCSEVNALRSSDHQDFKPDSVSVTNQGMPFGATRKFCLFIPFALLSSNQSHKSLMLRPFAM